LSGNKNTGKRCSRCQKTIEFLLRPNLLLVLGYATSERAQQNGADKRKHGTDRQHIEPQSKVHVTCSVLVAPTQKSSKGSRDGEATNILRCATQAEGIVPSLREPTQRFESSS
jgi:hypothetical protein